MLWSRHGLINFAIFIIFFEVSEKNVNNFISAKQFFGKPNLHFAVMCPLIVRPNLNVLLEHN